MRIKKLVSGAVAMSMVMATALVSNAAEPIEPKVVGDAPMQQTIPVKITTTALQIDVTLPTELTPQTDKDGNPIGQTTTITNNGPGRIKIAKVDVDNIGSWELTEYDEAARKQDVVDSKNYILDVNDTPATLTPESDEYAGEVDCSGWDEFDAVNGSQTINYKAAVSPQSKALTNEHIADVILTIDWYTTADGE